MTDRVPGEGGCISSLFLNRVGIHPWKGVWKPQSPKAHYLDSTSKRLWPKAQGCDEGATLGKASENIFNLEEVVAAGARSHNLFEVGRPAAFRRLPFWPILTMFLWGV